jgi:hypothetical protein
MAKKIPSKSHAHKYEPSWTGATAQKPGTTAKRLQQWLCTTDNKCVPVNADDFTQNINWRIFRIMAEFVEGFEFLSKLHKEVTIFGSTRATSASRYYQIAKQLGFMLGKNGYTVITGGGPGIMEAANWGAFESGGESVGLDISLPMEQRRNQYVKQSMGFRYFFTRKVMLSASAQAYVFFPGGFGTMDELYEMVTLIQTAKMSDQVPVILVGRSFWTPMLKWIEREMWENNRYIEKDDMKILQIVDTADEAFRIIKKTRERVL